MHASISLKNTEIVISVSVRGYVVSVYVTVRMIRAATMMGSIEQCRK
jgi:hypothetical protein